MCSEVRPHKLTLGKVGFVVKTQWEFQEIQGQDCVVHLSLIDGGTGPEAPRASPEKYLLLWISGPFFTVGADFLAHH